jgi:dTDP-4-dehydrorhamnose 3,5-epimerase
MIFTETKLKGAHIIDMTPIQDERGFFARTFCEKEFAQHGLETNFVQGNASRSRDQFTLRGMHFQTNGSEEVKVIRCVRGRIQDVIIDLRKDSETYCQWIAVELSEDNKRMLYVPRGFAHGFLTLEEDCEVAYMVSAFYDPTNERGVRYNDPAFGIEWAAEPIVLSEKDGKHEDYIK